MTPVQYWLLFGAILIVLETILPGGIVVFLGLSAISVAAMLHFGIIGTVAEALIAWFIISLVKLLLLRGLFIKYFEGDSEIGDVDDKKEFEGAIVDVIESIFPHKEGRIRHRDTTWVARSDDEIKAGETALVIEINNNDLIVKAIK